MSNYYNFNDIIDDMKKDIARHAAFAEAWRKVEFPTKKDGKPFANMSKNIIGAKYSTVSYAMQAGENELTVYTRTSASGYIYDTITVYSPVRYLQDPAMVAKTENYMPKQTYLEQIYRYDLDDIKKAVANRIAYWERYVADLQKQIEAAQKIFDNFRAAYDAAIRGLESDTAEFEHKDLMYAVKDCVISRYPYV